MTENQEPPLRGTVLFTMKTLLCSLLLMLGILPAVNAQQDPQQELAEAMRLAKAGDYEGALTKHVWIHDHSLSVSRSFAGVRLSFALSYWVDLGKKYPKALETLTAVRDAKTSKLLAGQLSPDLFQDVRAINRAMEEPKATVELFKKLDASNPDFCKTIYFLAEESLMDAKEYPLVKKYAGDGQQQYAAAERGLNRSLEVPKGVELPENHRAYAERAFTKQVVRIITLLIETGDKEGAKSIHAQALKKLDNETIRNAFNP